MRERQRLKIIHGRPPGSTVLASLYNFSRTLRT